MRQVHWDHPISRHPLSDHGLYVVEAPIDPPGPAFGAHINWDEFHRGNWMTSPEVPTVAHPFHGFRVMTNPWETWPHEDMKVYEVEILGWSVWNEASQNWYTRGIRVVGPTRSPDWWEAIWEFLHEDVRTLPLLRPIFSERNHEDWRLTTDNDFAVAMKRANDDFDIFGEERDCYYLRAAMYAIKDSFPFGYHKSAWEKMNTRIRTEIGWHFDKLDIPKHIREDYFGQIYQSTINAAVAMMTLALYENSLCGFYDDHKAVILKSWAAVSSGYALMGVQADGTPIVAGGPPIPYHEAS